MALSIPASLKLTQLKILASKCGISLSGTKPALTSRLINEISCPGLPSKTKTQVRILSIDMGIRNLAYCVIDLPAKASRKARTAQVVEKEDGGLNGSGKTKKTNFPEKLDEGLPIIQSWHRLAVSTAPAKTPEDEEDTPLPKEAFDPSTLSTIAYSLLRRRLLLHNPTHILIERQRFRSMGSPHILEWTIRVNMFESMLYAVLRTLKEEGVWGGEVLAVAPGKVGPFWIEKEGSGGINGGDVEGGKKKRMAKSSKVQNKGRKVDLVRAWLKDGTTVGLGNKEVREMARMYGEKWERLPGTVKGSTRASWKGGKEEKKIGKLDDLADCLLQGIAWIKWEENKRIALRDGVEALLEP